MIKRPPHRHNGGRGENASAMRLEDAIVNPRSQTEVVRVDDQPGRHMVAEERCCLAIVLADLSAQPSRPNETGSGGRTDLLGAQPSR